MNRIVCMKWGTKFPVDYVNVLYAAVKRNMRRPFEFICFTDDPTGLAKGITARELPSLGLPEAKKSKGGWPKLAMFKRGLFSPDDLVMVLDVDILIMGDLEPFFARAEQMGGLHILREWNIWPLDYLPFRLRPKQHGQSSVFMFRPKDQHHLLDDFLADIEGTYQKASNDQKYISWFAHQPHYFPAQWTVSFKRHCIKFWPLNWLFPTIKQPKTAKIVVFHGYPHPDHLIGDADSRWGKGLKAGRGPVKWVKAYWEKGLKASAGPLETPLAAGEKTG